MHITAKNYAFEFLVGHEGLVLCMYMDVLGLITTGAGNMIDKDSGGGFAAVQTLVNEFNWYRIKDNVPATPAEVEAEWNNIKALTPKGHHLKMNGKIFEDWAKKQIPPLVTLQIKEDEFIKNVFPKKVEQFENAIKKTPLDYFKDFDDFPADAQLGILSVAWANGAYSAYDKKTRDGQTIASFPLFRALCKEQDWRKIAAEKTYRWTNINDGRDIKTQKLFRNAANSFDKTKLIYPVIQIEMIEITGEASK
ncbi:MAG: hypothetical protein H7Z37_13180 [Pyrinomonadaceae bacterium]|nr:hypothetical protein [Pyrinomonadaceae bacterium]